MISDDKKLVKTEIRRTGFLPYLSDRAPSRGAEKIAKSEYKVKPSAIMT